MPSTTLLKSLCLSSVEGLDKYSAAVAVIFVKNDNVWSVILTRRSRKLRSHKGQISFPGGRREEKDLDAVHTAKRETQEELNLTMNALDFCGYLEPVQSIGGLLVVPVVFEMPSSELENLTNDPVEVEESYLEPVESFFPEKKKEVQFMSFGRLRNTVAYETPHFLVWGLTAKVLSDINWALLQGSLEHV